MKTRTEFMALSEAEAREIFRKTPGWSMEGKQIKREFQFRNFREAMDFVNEVARLAEEQDHHPDIFISYDKVSLTLSTHKVGGLTREDFTLAQKINGIL